MTTTLARYQSVWSANFRDLSASVTRMATLAPYGRITTTSLTMKSGG
nr:hypothetical protein [Rhizobium phaseoli]